MWTQSPRPGGPRLSVSSLTPHYHFLTLSFTSIPLLGTLLKSTLDELLFPPLPQPPVPIPVPVPVPVPVPAPATSPLPISLSIMFIDDIYLNAKDCISQPLYVCQSCSLQIIQLVECSPPPPQQKYISSRLSSSFYSDSQSDGSAYDSSSSSLSDGSSYCLNDGKKNPPTGIVIDDVRRYR
jgi:hypothetical protein